MTTLHIGNWGQTLVEALRSDGLTDAQIIGNSGINIRALDSDEPKIGFQDLAQLFERAAKLTGDDLLGFKHGQNSDYRRGGLLAYTGISSPTVRTFLGNLSRFQRVTGDALSITADSLQKDGTIEWQFNVPREVIRQQYVEFSSAALVGFVRKLTNRTVTPQAVAYRHFRKSNVTPMVRYFGSEIDFGARTNKMQFKLSDLDLPLQSADDHLYRILHKMSEEIVAKREKAKPSIIISVEECISSNPAMSKENVAKRLGMSTRTLARRLAEVDKTFFGLVEGYRASMSKSMLTDTDLQLTEIAYVVGYSEPSTFSTAFKRWTGLTPTEYRVRHSK